jgi:hypothetical protein
MFELPIIIIVTSITRIRCFRLEWLTLFGCFAELERFFRRLDLATPGNSRVGMFRQCGSCRCGRLGIGRPSRPNLDHRRHETPPRAAREKPGKYAVNRQNQLQRMGSPALPAACRRSQQAARPADSTGSRAFGSVLDVGSQSFAQVPEYEAAMRTLSSISLPPDRRIGQSLTSDSTNRKPPFTHPSSRVDFRQHTHAKVIQWTPPLWRFSILLDRIRLTVHRRSGELASTLQCSVWRHLSRQRRSRSRSIPLN